MQTNCLIPKESVTIDPKFNWALHIQSPYLLKAISKPIAHTHVLYLIVSRYLNSLHLKMRKNVFLRPRGFEPLTCSYKMQGMDHCITMVLIYVVMQ